MVATVQPLWTQSAALGFSQSLSRRAFCWQVVPSDVGASSPPWFLFTRTYWRQQKLDYVDEKLLAQLLGAAEQQVWRPALQSSNEEAHASCAHKLGNIWSAATSWAESEGCVNVCQLMLEGH